MMTWHYTAGLLTQAILIRVKSEEGEIFLKEVNDAIFASNFKKVQDVISREMVRNMSEFEDLLQLFFMFMNNPTDGHLIDYAYGLGDYVNKYGLAKSVCTFAQATKEWNLGNATVSRSPRITLIEKTDKVVTRRAMISAFGLPK